ncbi:unnamed protein product [Cylindrotheca closterium]|uniref:Uncharacterized protein n=1 Tax=Cylindrotheca closterium TaxID=2856 RepID=A0AAD2CBT6_9STRA|nr:unnamed protein product [Cylindrotheca closterium]
MDDTTQEVQEMTSKGNQDHDESTIKEEEESSSSSSSSESYESEEESEESEESSSERDDESPNKDDEQEIDEFVEFVYRSEDQEITETIKQTMTKLIVRGPNVKTIGKEAFRECEKLREIDFTEATALETIGEQAFAYCPSLLAFKCPSNVTTIGESAFDRSEKLKEIDFTEATALETIGVGSFFKCASLLAFKCPSNVNTIGAWAFGECENLKEIDITEATAALETIGNNAFSDCPSLYFEFVYEREDQDIPLAIKQTMTKLIVRGPNVKTIKEKAFENCEKLREIDFTEATSLETIGEQAFSACPSLLAFKCPSNLKTIELAAFASCQNLKEIDFTKATALEKIGDAAFAHCPSLAGSFKCPSNVKTIGTFAFADCEKLKETDFTEAAALENIGIGAFNNCLSLEFVYESEDQVIPETIKQTMTKLIVRGPHVNTIGQEAFSGCEKLKEIDFTEATALKTIGVRAFAYCPSLLAFKCPSHVKTIGLYAFVGCQNLKKIDSTESTALEKIGFSAFFSCPSLEKVYLAPNVTVVEKDVLKECPNLKCLKIPSVNPAIRIRLYTQLGKDQKHLINWDATVNVYASNPIKSSELLENSGEEALILQQVRANYIGSIVDGSRRLLSISERNGWLQFLANNVGDGNNDPDMSKLIYHLKTTEDIGKVRQLAETKDQSERVAKSVASKHIQAVFQARLFFLGRYDIARGPPIHQSATCVVVKATDAKMRDYFEKKYEPYEGKEVDKKLFKEILSMIELIPHDKENINHLFQRADVEKDKKISKEEFVNFCLAEIGGTVVLKFMRNKDQFRREVDSRKDNKLDSKYVVGSIRSHDEESDANLVQSLKDSILQEDGNGTSSFLKKDGAKAEDYCNVLVMPYGDRNLDTIFRSERLDILTIQTLAKEIGEAVAHIHEKGLIHGDLKMLNVVRINGHMVLIDMDASAKIGEDFAGEKYSSGVIPPEMIYQLANHKEKEQYISYFQDQNEEEQQKRAPKFSRIPTIQGYAVKSFLGHDETTTFEDRQTGNMVPKTKRMVTSKGNLPMFELVGADKSFDVWSFGVLLYTMCSKEPLFRVNTDDDITDGNSMRELFHWGQDDVEVDSILENSIQDDAAKKLLKQILKRNPKDRPPMKKILLDPFFTGKTTDELTEVVKEEFRKTQSLVLENRQIMQHGFSKIHESLKLVLSHQKAANNLLKGIFQGKNNSQPKYLIILPAFEQDNQEKRFSRFLSTMKETVKVKTKARLCFICPVSLQPVLGKDGKAIGYDIELAKDWVKKYGPAILIGLKIVQVGLAVGRGFGLPLPSLSGAEEGLKETSNLFSEMQGLLVEGIGGDAEEDGLADMMLEKFTDRIDSAASADGPGAMKKNHQDRIQKSYEGIGTLIKDEKFERCGLVQAISSNGKEYEYVHPAVEPLFEKFGSKCFEKSMEEREKENAILAAKAFSEKKKHAEKGSAATGGNGTTKRGTLASSVAAPQPGSGSPIKLMIEHHKGEVEMTADNGEIRAKSAISSSNADNVFIARLEDKLTKLEGKIDSTNVLKLQGIPEGSNRVVHKGWLRIRSRWPPYLWKERYVVVYKDGSITHYPNAGSSFSFVNWKYMEDGATMELRSAKEKVIATAKLSTRCSSKVAEWLQGNNWKFNNERSTTTTTTNSKNRKARIGPTGNVTNIDPLLADTYEYTD